MRVGAMSALWAMAVAIGVAAFPGVSRAVTTTETFYLTSDHCTGGCLTGQTYGGTIVVTDLGGGSLSFLVSLTNGNEFVSTGFDTDFGFNLISNPSITYSGVTTGFTPTGSNPQSAGSLHMDGTGYFEYGLGCTGCGSGASSPLPGPLSFTITAAGLTLASLEQNALSQYFAVDILSGTTGKTGAVDASFINTVPLPSAALLFGTALVGMGLLGRRRKKGLAATPA